MTTVSLHPCAGNKFEHINSFPGISATFARVEPPTYSTFDSIFFESTTPHSLFFQVCVDFSQKTVAVAAENRHADLFRSYFLSTGVSSDALPLGLYRAYSKQEWQQLCKILLTNNLFPKEWLPFFSKLAVHGTWEVNSKWEHSHL